MAILTIKNMEYITINSEEFIFFINTITEMLQQIQPEQYSDTKILHS